ncbi:hypothetical protein G7Z17_g3192 [Cylindrodendrum hubeiense]|uniref:Beta-xylosidase C-terminal Concanavalin A-like domain-containing protein n=1 Tax=Cylindrodendrum hubeiense TaxID=595255 RepID=A0A9P5HGE1_9HYPO|nr:hypothetical protein G7Z17_g3192 [Cylindrodendrum hubeiense]
MAPLRGVIWGCILLFSSSAWGIWNPIISGWNPDPAILTVGDDYYVATSSFEYWPGIPIYHSKDLSNWTLFSHALTRPEQLQLFGTPTAAGKYNTPRPEGPKMYYKDSWYYLLIAEGGTDNLHRSTIARSKSPSGPFTANPANPLMYNGQWGFDNLTVQSTGHATMMKTANGDWYATFIGRRNINGKSPLGRETFLTNVVWRDGWPVFNNGKPILLSEEVEPKSGPKKIPKKWVEKFKGSNWDKDWYQLRTPYTKNYETTQKGLVLKPNVFGLSDRDTPAALLRKQTSLNITFSAEVLGFSGNLGPRNKVGISAYLSEWQHQDIGIRGCVNQTGMCIYTESFKNKTITLGYSFGKDAPTYATNISSFWQAFGPEGYGVFSGASLALFGTGDGEPWPYNAPTVGFSKVTETYFQEDVQDYDRW